MMRNKEIEVIFFDLFYTLVVPEYHCNESEYDFLGISMKKWEHYAEDEEQYFARATGKVVDPLLIIEDILCKMERKVSEREKHEILRLRTDRFKNALTNVDPTIIAVLEKLKENGKKLCVVSNADAIDVMYWRDSPLSRLFDDAVFSYEVGYLKPQKEIYEIALNKMNTCPEKCLFVGDGGSDELRGSKEVGIRTILSSYFLKRESVDRIMDFADYRVEDFIGILSVVDEFFSNQTEASC